MRDIDAEPHVVALEDRAGAWQSALFDAIVEGYQPSPREDEAQQVIADLQMCLAHSIASPAVPVAALRALLAQHPDVAIVHHAQFRADLTALCDQAEKKP